MDLLLSSLVGGIVGLILSLIFEDQLIALKNSLIKRIRLCLFPPKKTIPIPNHFSIGNYVTSWLVIDGDGESEYSPETIICRIEGIPSALPEEISDLRNRIQRQEETKKINGEIYQWNGPLFSLEKYALGRTEAEENLEITFTFQPSDYFTFLATVGNLDTEIFQPPSKLTIRQMYLTTSDQSKPIPFLSHGFGIALTIITNDMKLVLSRRSLRTGIRAGQIDTSVVEGLHPILDRSSTKKSPDVFRAAIRGASEELGVQLVKDDIHFLGFGLDVDYYQWDLIGVAYASETANEIAKYRSRGISTKWEIEEIKFVEFVPKKVLTLLREEEIWSIGFTSIYYALVKEFGRSKVEDIARRIFG